MLASNARRPGVRVVGHPRARDSIEDLLARDPVCAAIGSYLVSHPDAADTAQGIAQWWIHRDLNLTWEALQKLARHGVVRAFLGGDGVYGYTKNHRMRRRLSRYLKGS